MGRQQTQKSIAGWDTTWLQIPIKVWTVIKCKNKWSGDGYLKSFEK